MWVRRIGAERGGTTRGVAVEADQGGAVFCGALRGAAQGAAGRQGPRSRTEMLHLFPVRRISSQSVVDASTNPLGFY